MFYPRSLCRTFLLRLGQQFLRTMKTYINISNVPVEIAEAVKKIAEAEFDGNESAAYRRLIGEALEARAKSLKKNKKSE